MFAVLTILTFLVMFVILSLHAYHTSENLAGEKILPVNFSRFISWTLRRISRFLKRRPYKRSSSWVQQRFWSAYPPGRRWIFVCLAASFFYLAVSGFAFSLVIPGLLRGLPLVLHVSLGGLFAVSLALAVVFRARDYNIVSEISEISPEAGAEPRPEVDKAPENLARSSGKNRTVPEKLLFWGFVLSGFIIVLTALLMMLPVFALPGHLQTVAAHRLAALAALLSGTAFLYLRNHHDRS